jgi:predicted O-methyltransferase YrrM
MSAWRRELRDHLVRSRERALGFPRDTQALAALRALPGPFVPWSAMAMRPSAVLRIVNEITVNERQRIVELGAGVSTLYVARCLRARGTGRAVSIEEDAGWAEAVRGFLADEGLDEVAEVMHVPLAEGVSAGTGSGVWYDPAALSGVGAGIDLLVVDGPTSRDFPDRRYPALSVLGDRLAPRCAVILDDAWRHGEREVLRRWSHESDLAFDLVAEDGIAVAHRGSAFAI